MTLGEIIDATPREVVPQRGLVSIFTSVFIILRRRERSNHIARYGSQRGILRLGLINTHPVEARFINKVRVGGCCPTSIAYTLIEDEIERFGVGPLSVGEGIAVGALGALPTNSPSTYHEMSVGVHSTAKV